MGSSIYIEHKCAYECSLILPVSKISAFPVKGQSALPITRYPSFSIVILLLVSLATTDGDESKTNLPPSRITILFILSLTVFRRMGEVIRKSLFS